MLNDIRESEGNRREWIVEVLKDLDGKHTGFLHMGEIVRCKECASYCGDGNKCLWGLLTVDMGYCHHGYRGGDCITKQTEPQTDCSWK